MGELISVESADITVMDLFGGEYHIGVMGHPPVTCDCGDGPCTTCNAC